MIIAKQKKFPSLIDKKCLHVGGFFCHNHCKKDEISFIKIKNFFIILKFKLLLETLFKIKEFRSPCTHTHKKKTQLTAYILVHIYTNVSPTHGLFCNYNGHNVMDQQSTPFINNLTNDIQTITLVHVHSEIKLMIHIDIYSTLKQ